MIFGTTVSKIQDTITTGSTLVIYDSELDPTFMDSNVLEQQSVINGTRNFIPFGDYAEFNVNVNIYKGKTSLENLKSWDKKNVYFYPHTNGNVVKDKFGEPLVFTINSIKPYYLTQTETYDVAIITLKSKDYAIYSAVQILGYGYQYGMNYGYGL